MASAMPLATPCEPNVWTQPVRSRRGEGRALIFAIAATRTGRSGKTFESMVAFLSLSEALFVRHVQVARPTWKAARRG